MTNEEKAKEIIKMSETKQVYDVVDIKSLEEALYDDLMQMAEWKDEQIKAVAEIIADIFGSPFEYSPLDEDMLENEVCENCCNGSDCNDALCWMKYFEMKYKNKITNNAK